MAEAVAEVPHFRASNKLPSPVAENAIPEKKAKLTGPCSSLTYKASSGWMLKLLGLHDHGKHHHRPKRGLVKNIGEHLFSGIGFPLVLFLAERLLIHLK